MPPITATPTVAVSEPLDQPSIREIRAGYAQRIAQLREEKQSTPNRQDACSCDVVFSRCFTMILIFGQIVCWSGVAAGHLTALEAGAAISLFAIATLLFNSRNRETDTSVSLVTSEKIHKAHTSRSRQTSHSTPRSSIRASA